MKRWTHFFGSGNNLVGPSSDMGLSQSSSANGPASESNSPAYKKKTEGPLSRVSDSVLLEAAGYSPQTVLKTFVGNGGISEFSELSNQSERTSNRNSGEDAGNQVPFDEPDRQHLHHLRADSGRHNEGFSGGSEIEGNGGKWLDGGGATTGGLAGHQNPDGGGGSLADKESFGNPSYDGERDLDPDADEASLKEIPPDDCEDVNRGAADSMPIERKPQHSLSDGGSSGGGFRLRKANHLHRGS
ncbi:hypothetical protein COLO4_25958 [Corchorus olitorius]|uniref:Uncharacterized protein n=1 Tax=Corchorus olitorius TaxID=93759 RepID=A0A1R3HZ58_9ROSI|nr:hypothetical protein COLO4_25958 [Corchorus olitorius]